MRNFWAFISIVFFGLSFSPSARAATPKKEPFFPENLAFVRTFDIEGFVQRQNERGVCNQTLRLRARYLDPDVNAFVGLLTNLSHFNRELTLGENPDTANSLWNWGGDFGIKRGTHLWELDLMGSVLSSRLGPALAIVGEHELPMNVVLFHRMEGNFYTGDTVADFDGGVYYKVGSVVNLTAGYRLFASKHMSRSGPHLGILLRFNSPKIPFLFPSLG